MKNNIDDLLDVLRFNKNNIKIEEVINKKSSIRDLFSITTYKEVCEELEENQEICPYRKIKQIEKLFNRGWIKDWSDKNQYKYYPYYTIDGSGGLVFNRSGCNCGLFTGQVAFYKDKETSDHIGKNFINIYKEIY